MPRVAARRSRPRLRALPLPGRRRGAGRTPRTTCSRSPARPRRSAGRSCGWSAAPTSPGRRSRTARSRAPTPSRAQSFGSVGRRLRRRRVGRGLHRADPARRPGGGDRAFPPLPGGRSPRRSASGAPATGSASPSRRPATPPAPRRPSATGAQHQTSFYGQLAAERAGLAADPALAGSVEPPDWRAEPRDRARRGRGRLLPPRRRRRRAAPRSSSARPPRASRPAVRAALAQMAIDLGRPEIGIRIGKDAAARRHHHRRPVLSAARRSPSATGTVPTEYAMAIARQESELNAAAASSVGARGLMQLMPATAPRHGRRRRASSSAPTRLTEPLYNARLGTEYLSRMLDRYDGSYVLATAAYNAGPGRVDQWLEKNGDPRDGSVDPVIWIESIPFTETRNYVMRVLESLHVYRARLHGRPEALRLVADIGAGAGGRRSRPATSTARRPRRVETSAGARAQSRSREAPAPAAPAGRGCRGRRRGSARRRRRSRRRGARRRARGRGSLTKTSWK